MSAAAESLWLRAIRAADARGLLPEDKSPLTPGELAAEAARQGEDRLVTLVDGWYYPTSYGRVHGRLSDEEAGRIVATLESEIKPESNAPRQAKTAPSRPEVNCALCGAPLARGARRIRLR